MRAPRLIVVSSPSSSRATPGGPPTRTSDRSCRRPFDRVRQLVADEEVLLLLRPPGLFDVGDRFLHERAGGFAMPVLVEDDLALVLDEAALREGAVERVERVLKREKSYESQLTLFF